MQIEGKIAGRQVAELNRAWREAEPVFEESKLVLDIRGITYLDDNALSLLAEIFAKTRAEFVADTPLTKYFAEQAVRGLQPENGNLREGHSQHKARKTS